MQKNKKYVAGDGLEYFMCPFTDFYLTCGPNESKYHMGIMAVDVRGKEAGVRYAYYAPATSKCIRTYPESGQVMWQTVNNVRCSNGYVGKVTYMTVHDDSMDAYAGLVVPQGNQLGNMGTKGNATGVHCHIEHSQSADTTWFKNSYGNWSFNREVDPEDVWYMDDTNIIHGYGNWKYIGTPIAPTPTTESDQILYPGSKVKFDGVFKVDILRSPLSTNEFGCTELTGISFNRYYNHKCNEYHWIPLNDWTEVNANGSTEGQDNIVGGGISFVKNNNIYTVEEIDVPTNSARIKMNGKDVWVFSTHLYEVSNN